GRDRTDDADRHAHRPGRMTVARLGTTNGHRLAGETTRLASRERIRVDGARRLDARGLERLAGLGADRARQLVGPMVEESGDAFEDLRPLPRRQWLLHRLLGRVDRPPGFFRARTRDGRHDLTRMRRTDLEGIP